MLYLKSSDGGLSIVILETANLEAIQKGQPVKTPDGSILIAWTPDPVWLADRILESGGDAQEIGRAIDEAARRPQKPQRPYHKEFQARLADEKQS